VDLKKKTDADQPHTVFTYK